VRVINHLGWTAQIMRFSDAIVRCYRALFSPSYRNALCFTQRVIL